MPFAPINDRDLRCSECRVTGRWNKAYNQIHAGGVRKGGDLDYHVLCDVCAVLKTLAGVTIHWLPGGGAYCPACMPGKYTWGKRGRPIQIGRKRNG